MTIKTLVLAIVMAFTPTPAPLCPQVLWIHGDPWAVAQAWFWPPTLGRTDCPSRTIAVQKMLAPRSKALVLTHEIEHAFTCGTDGLVHNEKWNNTSDGDHPGIYWSSGEWVEFLRDNPEYVAFVQGTK